MDKELLLKDLCARLPYGVKVQIIDVSDYTNEYISPKIKTLDYLLLGKLGAIINGYRKDEIKPYLFPMSSLTDEQKKEFDQLIELELKAISDEIDSTQATAFEIDFYNKHHLDWRGLIPLGLAIDATNLNIY